MFQSMYNKSLVPLTDDMIRRVAPSVFAEDAHDSRSARYTYIPTINIVEGLRKAGFVVSAAMQSKTRDASRREFTKHMLRFRHVDVANPATVGDTTPEVVLINSHDGTSSYRLNAGLFRLVCLNGLMVADETYADVKVPHKGDVIGQVIDGAYEVIEESRKALEVSREWGGIMLEGDERMAMAEAARVLRLGDAEGNVESPIQASAFLRPRRYGDDRNDLWTTFNVIQENAIKGGLFGYGRDTNNRLRRTSTRQVKSIDADTKLNKALWTLAEKMAELKS